MVVVTLGEKWVQNVFFIDSEIQRNKVFCVLVICILYVSVPLFVFRAY